MYIKLLIGIVVGVASVTRAAEGYSRNTDTCGDIHQVLKVPRSVIPGNKYDVGYIDACICLNDIYRFVSSDPVALKGAEYAGKSYVVSAITTMVRRQGQVCHYPEHAVATCTKSNPCKFDCKDGYQPFPRHNPTQCVCKKPYMECNGQCGIYQGCPSGRPHYRRSSRDYLCPAETEACGVWNRGAKTWDCIDTQSDLENCGGCVMPLPGQEGRRGEDCSALEGGYRVVGCEEGRCVTRY